ATLAANLQDALKRDGRRAEKHLFRPDGERQLGQLERLERSRSAHAGNVLSRPFSSFGDAPELRGEVPVEIRCPCAGIKRQDHRLTECFSPQQKSAVKGKVRFARRGCAPDCPEVCAAVVRPTNGTKTDEQRQSDDAAFGILPWSDRLHDRERNILKR